MSSIEVKTSVSQIHTNNNNIKNNNFPNKIKGENIFLQT